MATNPRKEDEELERQDDTGGSIDGNENNS